MALIKLQAMAFIIVSNFQLEDNHDAFQVMLRRGHRSIT